MNYYELIKQELINNEVYKKVKDYSKNRSDLQAYYNVGKMLVEAQGGDSRAKYGDGLIKEYSKKLMIDIGKGYSEKNLRYMRQFYLLFKDEKWYTVCTKLSWSHIRQLLWFNDINKMIYYITISQKQNLSVRELYDRIKSNEYERLDYKTKLKLLNKEENNVEDFIKNPIVIRSNIDKEK